MLKRFFLLFAAALLATSLAAGPAQAGTGSGSAGQEGVTTSAAGGPVRPAAASCDQPCWPDCAQQFYPCWQLITLQYLTANPVESMTTSCISGRLQLGAGRYDWGSVFNYQGYKLWQNLYLGAGWYGMETCMDPHDNHRYTLSVHLYPDNTQWQPIHTSQDIWIYVSDYWQWGAYLDPLF